MRKIAILGSFLLLSACAGLKHAENRSGSAVKRVFTGNVIDDAVSQNLSQTGFFISKAEIVFKSGESKEKFIGTIKFEYPDKYLISIKNRTGIEGARAYVSNDSVLVNSRMNKTLYIGRAFYFRRKFGIDQSVFPLLFGDLVKSRSLNVQSLKCDRGKAETDINVRGIQLHYSFDCERNKLENVILTGNSVTGDISLAYSKFRKTSDIVFPGNILITDIKGNMSLQISIIKIEYPWSGKISFIPGKGYETIELL